MKNVASAHVGKNVRRGGQKGIIGFSVQKHFLVIFQRCVLPKFLRSGTHMKSVSQMSCL